MVTIDTQFNCIDSRDKSKYLAPRLIAYGSVQDLTQGGGATSVETVTGNNPITCSQNAKQTCNPSDLRLKDVLFATGKHACGVSTYLYSYKSQHAARCGTGAFVGVMAQDVLSVRPEAVILGEDGFYAVDYALLGGKITH